MALPLPATAQSSLFAPVDSQYFVGSSTVTITNAMASNPVTLSAIQARTTFATPTVLTDAVTSGPGTDVTVNLFDDASYTVRLLSYGYPQAPADRDSDSIQVWVGSVVPPGTYSPPDGFAGVATFAITGNGDLVGVVRSGDGRHFEIWPVNDSSGKTMIVELASTTAEPDDVEAEPEEPLVIPDTQLIQLEEPVRVLVLVTEEMSEAAWCVGGLNCMLGRGRDRAQMEFAELQNTLNIQYGTRTTIPVLWENVLELVGPYITYTVPDAGYTTDVLIDLIAAEYPGRHARDLRSRHAADLVYVYRYDGTHGECGRAPWASGHYPTGTGGGWAGTGFQSGPLCADSQTYTMAHEIGHMLGALHDPEASADPGESPVAGFWSATIGGRAWGDIMAYKNHHCAVAAENPNGLGATYGLSGSAACTNTRWFSSPGFFVISSGGPVNPIIGDENHDNIGHMIDKHEYVTGWCEPPTFPRDYVECHGQPLTTDPGVLQACLLHQTYTAQRDCYMEKLDRTCASDADCPEQIDFFCSPHTSVAGGECRAYSCTLGGHCDAHGIDHDGCVNGWCQRP